MGKASCYDGDPRTIVPKYETPTRTIGWEIEAKVNLLNYNLEHGHYVTEHAFYYDKDDNYICSITDTRKFKKKTEQTIIHVGMIPVFIRKEELSEVPKSLPKEAVYFRKLERTRYGYEVGDCFVAIDKLVSMPSGVVLHQMEVEYSGKVKTFEEGLLATNLCADVMNAEIAKLTCDCRIDFKGCTKYDWLKRVEPALSFSRGVGAWIQKLAGF